MSCYQFSPMHVWTSHGGSDGQLWRCPSMFDNNVRR